MSKSREEILRDIEAFNKRAEQLNKAAHTPATPPTAPPAIPDGDKDALLNAPPEQLNAAQRIERQAIQTSTDVQKAEEARAAAEKKRQEQEGNTIDKFQQAGDDTQRSAMDSMQPAIRWFENVPTPAGLGTILALIVLFLLAVVPVDAAGNTRAKLIWYTLTGKTHLAPLPAEASGDFGPGSNTPQSPLPPGTKNIPFSYTPNAVNNGSVTFPVPDLTGIDLMGL